MFYEVVKAILSNSRIDVNLVNDEKQNALHYCVLQQIPKVVNGSQNFMQLLLDHDNVDVNARDMDGMTPLMYAASNGKVEVFFF